MPNFVLSFKNAHLKVHLETIYLTEIEIFLFKV